MVPTQGAMRGVTEQDASENQRQALNDRTAPNATRKCGARDSNAVAVTSGECGECASTLFSIHDLRFS